MKTINKTGLKEIADFLVANHKDGENIVKDNAKLNAWASQAENNQDYIHIELSQSESWRNQVQLYEISEAGIDSFPDLQD